MAKVSKFYRVHNKVLLEWIWDENGLKSENYEIINNARTDVNYFVSDSPQTYNLSEWNLFKVDSINNTWGTLDDSTYTYLTTSNYNASSPIRYDKLKVHIPSSWTFGEYLGFVVQVWVKDYNSDNKYILSSYRYDISDDNQSTQLDYSNPPLDYNEQQWGKYVEIEFPSAEIVSKQRTGASPTENSLNNRLAPNIGIDDSSPVFIDFYFLTSKSTSGGITTWSTELARSLTVPLVPEYKNLAVMIEENSQYDYFEYYGIYNGTTAEFKTFLEVDSIKRGNFYYVQYNVIIWEEGQKTSEKRFTVTNNFDQPIEDRPILKFTSSAAIIEVEMSLIDQVDGSIITRKATYALYNEQVNKYGLNVARIKTSNTQPIRVYNVKYGLTENQALYGLYQNGVVGGLLSGPNGNLLNQQRGQTNQEYIDSLNYGLSTEETIEVPYPVFVERYNVLAKTDSVRFSNNTWWGMGRLALMIYPFDNVFEFTLAKNIGENNVETMNIPSNSEINMVFKNSRLSLKVELYSESDSIDLSIGQLAFRIEDDNISTIREIYNSGVNLWYITSTADQKTTVIYSGLFELYDSADNVSTLNDYQEDFITQKGNNEPELGINIVPQEERIAIVRKKRRNNNRNNT